MRRMKVKGEWVVVVRRIQSDSKDEKVGSWTVAALKVERQAMARPPPRPVVRGEWKKEKLGGVRLLMIEGRVS